jgi:hypothetical protein
MNYTVFVFKYYSYDFCSAYIVKENYYKARSSFCFKFDLGIIFLFKLLNIGTFKNT